MPSLLTPEQKAKIKARLQNVAKKVQSGELQTVVTAGTRYSQGKPVVIQKPISKEQQKNLPNTTLIFGIPVKNTHLLIGTALTIWGIVAVTKKRANS